MQKGSCGAATGAAGRLALAAVLAAAWACAGCTSPRPAGPVVMPATAPAGPGLSLRDGKLYRNGQPYRGVGANQK